MLLNGTPFAFVIDLAALASRREYLKLDKWLTDKIREHGVSPVCTLKMCQFALLIEFQFMVNAFQSVFKAVTEMNFFGTLNG